MPATTQLPAGWTYETAQIDMIIHGRAAQIHTIVELFSQEIGDQPAEVAAAARAWVQAQSAEGPKLSAHTFGPDDQARIDAAARALDAACGMG